MPGKIYDFILNIPHRIMFLSVFVIITILAIIFYNHTSVFSYILFVLLIPAGLLVSMTIGPVMFLIDKEWHYEVIFICSLLLTMLFLYFFGLRLDKREEKGEDITSSL
ncbi:MAG: hypothetical protein N3B13_05715 [Deltaproteobacteria bacterium]|nr:hypothetical protein [Deltaproteobacteria bacterium]